VIDDGDILELMRYALEHRGARVDAVQSAAAALERLSRRRYDVLVSDLGLPEKDGLTLMREYETIAADQRHQDCGAHRLCQ
jgi:DNA-binding response OmpR family regulator